MWRIASVPVLLAFFASLAHAGDRMDAAIRMLASKDLVQRVEAPDRLGHCGKRPECARAVRALDTECGDFLRHWRDRTALNLEGSHRTRYSAGLIEDEEVVRERAKAMRHRIHLIEAAPESPGG